MGTSRAATFRSRSRSPDFVELLIDLFGYLSIILHGLTIVAQSMALGGVFFIAFLARPFAARARFWTCCSRGIWQPTRSCPMQRGP